ncbi:MAG: hypothetical protein CME98_21920 [Hyphomonas sp.]|nr:hypothetical protein [Hyphomonas sp.]
MHRDQTIMEAQVVMVVVFLQHSVQTESLVEVIDIMLVVVEVVVEHHLMVQEELVEKVVQVME